VTRRILAALLALPALLFFTPPLPGQSFQLAPVPPDGHFVPPWFEGWYGNADGSFTYSFGYFNRNQRDTVEVAIGPDNYIDPPIFNGWQPTSFPPGRHAGVFTVTVPAGYEGDVVWHLRTAGQENRVPGRATAPAYELSFQPMAVGSVPPTLRFDRNGPAGRGPRGVEGPELPARVGTGLELTAWVTDESVRDRPAETGINWYKHQGPGRVSFSNASQSPDEEGRIAATALFSEPGEYLIRVRADNFRAPDSTPADQCCWTNGYLRVRVSP
jgi:hypothetical protein